MRRHVQPHLQGHRFEETPTGPSHVFRLAQCVQQLRLANAAVSDEDAGAWRVVPAPKRLWRIGKYVCIYIYILYIYTHIYREREREKKIHVLMHLHITHLYMCVYIHIS